MHELTPGSPSLRALFPALHQEVNGHPLLYFDNAATTHKPTFVIRAITDFYEKDNSNVHRGLHELSARATASFEAARQRIGSFISAPNPDGVIFTRGATEAINLVASAWANSVLQPGDRILLTAMEHHSNIVPWQLLANRARLSIAFAPLTPEGRLDFDELDQLLAPPTRLFAFTHISNVLGTVNPAEKICALAHSRGIATLVDAAQSCGHFPLDMEALNCDFLVLSGHKMCGPTGIGVLAIHPRRFGQISPWQGGGEMIERVTFEGSTYKSLPHLLEAGTPPIASAIALAVACDFLDSIGRDAIRQHDEKLAMLALDLFSRIEGMEIIGPRNSRAGVVSFTLTDVHPHDVVEVANRFGLALRGGHHCAQPLMRVLAKPSTARASFYLYTTEDEVHRTAEILAQVRKFFN